MTTTDATAATAAAALSSADTAPIARAGLIRMFNSLGVIGDSLSSGEIETANADGTMAYIDRPRFSWLAHLSRKYGIDYRCFSSGGLTCADWLDRFLDDLTGESTPRDGYYLALGTNDRFRDCYPLGDADDGPTADTFAGRYRRIIEAVRDYAPHSVIMCCTLYSRKDDDGYDDVIRTIAASYKRCLLVDVARESAVTLDDLQYRLNGHFSAYGYVAIADEIERLTNEAIARHPDLFAAFPVDAPSNALG
ncbi:SGNH/GDSL hydrolase family protein [Bifidobacterium avesanii]|nr:SGNH/GDSL hydrolase family protein [Bifidobacterium avesanii]KAB8294601.1 GDSL-like Lipase/Acylhydrolase family [Bifidobacterium avesanii]